VTEDGLDLDLETEEGGQDHVLEDDRAPEEGVLVLGIDALDLEIDEEVLEVEGAQQIDQKENLTDTIQKVLSLIHLLNVPKRRTRWLKKKKRKKIQNQLLKLQQSNL
jgi:hypothetical protein